MGGGQLDADAGLAARHHRIGEADDVDAVLEQVGGQLLGQAGVAQHDGHDGVGAGLDVEAGPRHAGAEVAGVVHQAIAQIGRPRQQVEDRQRGAGHHRRQAVGEQVGARALAQQVDDVPAGRREAAGGAAQGLAERRGDDVDPSHHPAVLGGAAPAGAHEAGGVRVVDHDQGVVALGQIADGVEAGHRSKLLV